jgi:hypothetical protein
MECEYFKSFRYFEPEIQSGSVTHCDSPDFRVDVSDRVVGVEVTRLFKPDGGQDVESTRERILEEACRRAQEWALPPAHVRAVTLTIAPCVGLPSRPAAKRDLMALFDGVGLRAGTRQAKLGIQCITCG